jgi:hypothetical protein
MRILALIFLTAGLALPQDIVERTYVIRADTTTIDEMSGMTQTCVLVFPDGKYRLEKTFSPNSGGSPEVRVYLDQLPDANFKQLQAALDDSTFQQISTPESRGGIIQNMDILTASIPRDHTIQNFTFPNADSRRQYEKSLKPLVNWMRATEKLKVQVAKSEKPTNCVAPRVMYRTMVHPQRTDDAEQH